MDYFFLAHKGGGKLFEIAALKSFSTGLSFAKSSSWQDGLWQSCE
jgi:hypothetical protein